MRETVIRYARKSTGFNQKDFAAQLEISPQYLSDLETGRRSLTPEMADRLHETMGRCCDAYDSNEKSRKQWHQIGARQHGWAV